MKDPALRPPRGFEQYRDCAPEEVAAIEDSIRCAREREEAGKVDDARSAMSQAGDWVRRARWTCEKPQSPAPAVPPPAGDLTIQPAEPAEEAAEQPPASPEPAPAVEPRDPVHRPLGERELQENLVVAQLQIAEERRGRGEIESARDAYRETIESFRKHTLPAGGTAAGAAAQACFQLAELKLAAFDLLSLDVPLEKLERTMRYKAKLLRRLEEMYQEVMPFGSPAWTLAASYRIGYLYDRFSQALLQVSCGTDLSEDDCTALRHQVKSWAASPLEEAISAYQRVLEESGDLQLANEWTEKTRDALEHLRNLQGE